MKIGVEVEGRFKGLKTLFVTAEEFQEKKTQIKLLLGQIGHGEGIQQLYISDLANNLDLGTTCTAPVLVTVERSFLYGPAPSGVHVILNCSTPSFNYLKLTDQVKFVWNGGGCVATCVRENMQTTVPADFERDVEL